YGKFYKAMGDNHISSDNLQNTIGAVLLGASFALSFHSIIRMSIMRTTGSKMYLFPIANAAQLLNEFAVVFMVISESNILGNRWYRWNNTINSFSYLITKPIVLYLAFLRCRSVFEIYRKYPAIHYFIITSRAVELFIYTYAELFSCALTLFVMTEFGLEIPKLFKPRNISNSFCTDQPFTLQVDKNVDLGEKSVLDMQVNTFGVELEHSHIK
ncbi:5798_t:CDS:2, partial [Acaulospora colombiana]